MTTRRAQLPDRTFCGFIPATNLVRYDLESGKMTVLSRALKGLDNDNVIFGHPAGTYVLVSGQGAVITDSKTGRFAAYRYDFATDSIVESLFEHPTNDAAELIMSADDTRVAGIA